MRTFLGQRDAATLATDPAFVKARDKLSEALGGVVATTEARFDDPWDVLAMDAAAARLGTLESTIISTRFAARYAEAEAAPAAPSPPQLRVRARARPPPRRRQPQAAARDWTAEERELFARHVVNLREGKLSSDGSFSSSAEQVEPDLHRADPRVRRRPSRRSAGRRACCSSRTAGSSRSGRACCRCSRGGGSGS